MKFLWKSFFLCGTYFDKGFIMVLSEPLDKTYSNSYGHLLYTFLWEPKLFGQTKLHKFHNLIFYICLDVWISDVVFWMLHHLFNLMKFLWKSFFLCGTYLNDEIKQLT